MSAAGARYTADVQNGRRTSEAPTLLCERRLQRQGFSIVAGVDEVGRGSWAGPLVTAAVVLPAGRRALGLLRDCVRDSKQLAPRDRVQAYRAILSSGAIVAVGWASHHVIDSIGLAPANRRAMCRAVDHLNVRPDALLLDHFALPECPLPQTCVTKGDSRCLSVAAASIVAKLVRDDWMMKADARYPGYGFARHKGYGTGAHVRALRELGPSPLHRRTFAPVAALPP